jgi:O-antigen ligase
VVLRLFPGMGGAALILLYVLRAPRSFDAVDRGVLLALLLFTAAAILSAFPRQSLDAVLAAFGFVAAFWLARDVLRSEDARRRLVLVLVALSAIVTLVFVGRWVVPVLEWWRGTGWSVLPPLNFELGGSPWGHRHNVGMLVVMVYPAWWIGRPSLIRRTLAGVFGVLALLVVLVGGSRAVWAGAGVATLVIGLPIVVRWWRSSGMPRAWVLAAAVLAVLVAVVSGLATSLAARAFNLATLDYRAALWGSIVEDWARHPVTGNGPGSFPWVLQSTGYFDTNSLAPRHPDSAVMQMLAEGGLLGIGALLVIVVVVGPAVMRGRSRAAAWALVAFAIASLIASPTDFAFLVVVAIAWAAYAAPREASVEVALARRSPMLVASLLCAAVIGVAHASTTIAAFAYERARSVVAGAADDSAYAALDTAIAFDPSMSLYHRQRGALGIVLADVDGAIPDLERAVHLNPADDLAWRTLAQARMASGDGEGAERDLARAIELQRSDPTNLLLAASWAAADGRVQEANALLAEVVHAWPTTVFAPGWSGVLPSDVSTETVVAEALARWENAVPIPTMVYDQGVWLAGIQGDDLLADAPAESPWPDELDEALVQGIGCVPVAATLDALDPSIQRIHLYWWLRIHDTVLAGDAEGEPARMAGLMGPAPRPEDANLVLNPLDENGDFSADRWGYRRSGIAWPLVSPPLPSADAGLKRWLFEPEAAVRDAGLDAHLPSCLR